MRIRKNAKKSALFYTNTNLLNDSDECLLEKNLCQLNQSPWDIITFPSSDSSSSLHQFDDNEVYYNVNPAGNGSSVDSVGAFESLVSVKTSNGEIYDNIDDQKTNYGEILGFEEGESSEFCEETVLCGKRDEKGWHCERMVKNGNTMCEHHIVELQNDAVWTTKKSRPINGPKAGTRPRQTKKQASTNPYEFYYYSGFGPFWGKKRGGSGSNTYHEVTQVKEMITSTDNNNMGVVKEEKRLEPEKMELANYIDDDDDNDKNMKSKMGINGKKRGRKPMKARSLKSLM